MPQSLAKNRIFPKGRFHPAARPCSGPSAVDKADVLAPSVEDAGDKLYPGVAAALPAQLGSAAHILQHAGLHARAWSEIDPDALANLPSLGPALFNRHALKRPDGLCTQAWISSARRGRSVPATARDIGEL